MRRDIIIIALIAMVVIALAIVLVPLFFGPSSAEIGSVSFDKDLYHSNEVMNITISVNARGATENATLRLAGIKDRYGDLRLEKEIPVILSPGLYTVTYDYKLPPCSHCAGIDPGPYQIEVELVRNGTVISNTTRTVQLEQ